MNNMKYFLIPLFAIFLVIGAFAFGYSMNNPSSNIVENTIEYHSMVCKQVTRADGTIEPKECSPNLLYDTGKEAIEDYLADGSGGNDAFDWIQLCNASKGCQDAIADKTEDYNAATGCGTNAAAGSVTDNGGNGNWSVGYEFTSTCDDVSTNATRLRNDDDDDLAGNSYTIVNLQTNDKLLVNWTVWVS